MKNYYAEYISYKIILYICTSSIKNKGFFKKVTIKANCFSKRFAFFFTALLKLHYWIEYLQYKDFQNYQ